MDTAPDKVNPHDTVASLEKEIFDHLRNAAIAGGAAAFFFLLVLAAWNAVFMASAVGWWGATCAATGGFALSEFVKASRKIGQIGKLYWARHSQTTPNDHPEGHSHVI